ncbi:general stress protein [Mycolicibacterium thermoresistibile]
MTTPTGPSGPAPTGQQQCIASFSDYADAQRLVDRMSDGGFPVQYVRIIGDDLRTIEHVTGRMTKGRAALAGAGTGAWFGLLIGLLLSIFAVGPLWLWVWLIAAAIGAFWGAVFGFVAHWSTRGERDFSSVQSLVAQRYDVFVTAEHAAEASRFVQPA